LAFKETVTFYFACYPFWDLTILILLLENADCLEILARIVVFSLHFEFGLLFDIGLSLIVLFTLP
jgi:hypothetical protein